MADQSGPIDQESSGDVTINPISNPQTVTQTSTVETLNNQSPPEIAEDGFEVSVNLTSSDAAQTQQVNLAIVIDQSNSTGDDSGTDFDGDGTNETVLEAQLFAAAELFSSYVAAGFDPQSVEVSLITYTSAGFGPLATVRGTFTLDQASDFVDALTVVQGEGPQLFTRWDAGLDAVGDAWTASGASSTDTNLVIFMSDGEPVPAPPFQDYISSRQQLEADWGATIRGLALGELSALGPMQDVDNTDEGAQLVTSGDQLLEFVVQPLTDAEFLRFELVIDGVDENGDPVQQIITLLADDPNVIPTQLGWSIDCLLIDPSLMPPQDVTFTVNAYFAEDPGNPGSGEQLVQTVHDLSLVVCFTPGTEIRTPEGQSLVEDLCVGDLVVTRDHGSRPIRWIGRTTLPASFVAARRTMRPVNIRKGALGPDLPTADLRVSRQHRILVRDWRAELLFGADDGVLVPAIALCNDFTVVEERPESPVTYIHLAFDDHEIVFANGVEAESFQPAARTVSTMNSAQKNELLALFPELDRSGRAYGAARSQPRLAEARVLAPRPI